MTIGLCAEDSFLLVHVDFSFHPVSPYSRNRYDKILVIFATSIKSSNTDVEVCLWGPYSDNKPITNPYYGGMSIFERLFEQCVHPLDPVLDKATDR